MHTAFCIADGRTCFYQWDVNQQMLVADETIKELHFCNGTSECSLVCKVEDGKADVPNILLQSARSISVYGYTGDHTKIQKIFRVNPRTKPEDYVYTETEVKRYEALEKRVDALEKVEPPAPYVLPAASAEVKGGVKVGSGLRMDGDVLGVVPEEAYELIENITLEEEVSAFERNFEGLKGLYIVITSPGTDAAKVASISIYFPSGIIYYTYATNAIGAAEGYKSIYRAERKGNKWNIFQAPGGTKFEPNAIRSIERIMENVEGITGIKITATIPVGTTIEIWGVRADA